MKLWFYNLKISWWLFRNKKLIKRMRIIKSKSIQAVALAMATNVRISFAHDALYNYKEKQNDL